MPTRARPAGAATHRAGRCRRRRSRMSSPGSDRIEDVMTELHEREDVAAPVSRRNVLLRLGAALTALGGGLMALPIVGFVFSSFARPKHAAAWVSLGPLEQFPVNQTRLAVYRNPYTRP